MTENTKKVCAGITAVASIAILLLLFLGGTSEQPPYCIPATKENGRFDVDNDGVVNMQDSGLIWVHRTVENGISTGEPYDMTYDMDCDGDVDLDDSTLCWDNRD